MPLFMPLCIGLAEKMPKSNTRLHTTSNTVINFKAVLSGCGAKFEPAQGTRVKPPAASRHPTAKHGSRSAASVLGHDRVVCRAKHAHELYATEGARHQAACADAGAHARSARRSRAAARVCYISRHQVCARLQEAARLVGVRHARRAIGRLVSARVPARNLQTADVWCRVHRVCFVCLFVSFRLPRRDLAAHRGGAAFT